MQIIYLATYNQHKICEFTNLLEHKEWIIKSVLDLNVKITWVENANTFEENALIKARQVKKYTDAWVIADDSGLEVDALNNMPGVLSKRFAGINATYEQNNQKLLQLLSNIPFEKRKARFICSLAFIDENHKEYVFTGSVEGFIATTPKGTNGFGYDPIFYYPPLKKSFAELSLDEKNKISHRAQAIRLWEQYVIQNLVRGKDD